MNIKLATIEAPRNGLNRITRAGYAGIGVLFVGLGIVGVFVPGLPTTVFCILALWCFKRSSERLENWLLNHKWLGPTLRDWDENRWMSARAKTLAISSIVLFSTASCFMINKPDLVRMWSIRGAIIALALFGIGYIATRRTKPAFSAETSSDSLAA